MRMRGRLLPVLACAVALCLLLAGCQSSVDEQYKGVWDIQSIESESGDVSEDDIEYLKKEGFDAELVLADDGSAAFCSMGSSALGTWELEDETLTLTFGETTETAKLDEDDDSTMVVESDSGDKLTMKRTDAEVPKSAKDWVADYDASNSGSQAEGSE
jgi:hypothetical protein